MLLSVVVPQSTVSLVAAALGLAKLVVVSGSSPENARGMTPW
jgi:hypothetical protein